MKKKLSLHQMQDEARRDAEKLSASVWALSRAVNEFPFAVRRRVGKAVNAAAAAAKSLEFDLP